MKKLQESLLDDDNKLFNDTNKDIIKFDVMKNWLNDHDEYHDWLGTDKRKKIIKYGLEKDGLYINCEILELNVDNDIPGYIKLFNTDKFGKLYIDCNNKSLNIKGSFEGFNEIYIYNYNPKGNIIFQVPIYTKRLWIISPELISLDISKIKAQEIILENCDNLDLSKCKFPKGDYKYVLSNNVKNKLLQEVYKKYGLNPNNAE